MLNDKKTKQMAPVLHGAKKWAIYFIKKTHIAYNLNVWMQCWCIVKMPSVEVILVKRMTGNARLIRLMQFMVPQCSLLLIQ